MMSIFRRFWQIFSGPPEEQIVELEIINENNKRCRADHYSGTDFSHETKRFRYTSEDTEDTDVDNEDSMNTSDSFQTPSFLTKSNGTHLTMDKKMPSGHAVLRDKPLKCNLQNEIVNGHTQKLKEVSSFNYYNKPTVKNINTSLNKSSALDDVVKMREKLAYSTLIKSQTPTSNIFSNINKNRFYDSRLIVDLTIDNNKSQYNSAAISTSHKNNKSCQEPSKNFSHKLQQNITIRKKITSPITKHTEWIHNLTKQFDQKAVQLKLKINDEKLRADVFKNKNKIFHEIIDERLLKQLEIKEVIDLIEEPSKDETVLPVFSPEDDARINKAMRASPHEQIIQKFGYSITGACIYSLSGLNWLNDNVINFYMKLLTQRGAEPGNPKVHAMDSFFCVSLRTRGYSSVRRWTRKVDIFSFDFMPIPVHVNGVHWCMLIINFKDKSLKYYDSMGGNNKGVLDMVENYLKEESLDKKKVELDFSEWTKETVKDIPQQMNGCDCGVFSCMFAEYICRGAKISFSQQEMKYFRRKMCLEIINGKLLT